MLTLNIDILSVMYKTREKFLTTLNFETDIEQMFCEIWENNVMLQDVKFHDLSFILNSKGSLLFWIVNVLYNTVSLFSQILSEYQQKAR